MLPGAGSFRKLLWLPGGVWARGANLEAGSLGAIHLDGTVEGRVAVRVARKGPVPQSFGSQEQRRLGEGRREREGSTTMPGARAWPRRLRGEKG